jgi:hypothetical protein
VNSNVSAWTFGGSILTFAFPMLLFIVVAGALYVLYTKPEFVPGHPAPGLERPVSYTPVPGKPTVEAQAQPATETAPASAAETPPASAAETAPASAAGPAGTEADAGETATTEDAE